MTLGERIAAGEDAFEAVLAWVAEEGLTPYEHQEEAILELVEGSHVILATPTGSGKSLVAIALHAVHLAAGQRSIYTAPIKALVAEKFFALCTIFGAERVGMMTGDGTVNRDADIICCTAEILEKLALRYGEHTPFAGVVMDEFHYYGDRDRGMAWQVPLLTMPHARFLLMSATLGPTVEVERRLVERTGVPVTRVDGAVRPVPLEFRYSEVPLLQAIDDLIKAVQAPIYTVNFTQRGATELAQGLLSNDLADRDQKDAIKLETRGFRFDSPFGKHLRRMVLHGVGLHHAGLLPKYRMLVEKLAQKGLFKVISGTDTLGVGINVPIRTVLFSQLCKYDGASVDILTVRDFLQIGGRAGRKGYDDHGLVVAQAPAWVVENARTSELVSKGRKKKPKVKAQPPTRGYKHWDEGTFERLKSSPPEALEPRFHLDHSVVLALLRRAQDRSTDPLDEIDTLIGHAHTGERESARLREQARERIGDLVLSGIAEPVKGEHGVRYTVYDDLQDNFSVYHALSLFLLHLVGQLDPESPDYALDVITCVEAILEHPKVVLFAQVRREKGRKIGELKAEGVPYEERMEALEEVTWPKPRDRWLYDQFEEWRVVRPWLAGDPVRPKSVVREMVEQFALFPQYVKELGIDRSEGVLLRYISQVYKTLQQGVPVDARTDALEDHLAFLRAMLARVDDSLVTTWEALRTPEEDAEGGPDAKVDISRDMKRFRRRIRAELHAVVRALTVGDPDEAAASVRQVPGSEFGAADFKRGLAAFEEELGPLAWDGRIKQAWNTIITEQGPHRWTVSQRLLPADLEVDPDEVTWSIDGLVDLSDDTAPPGPIVQVLAFSE